MVHKVTDDFSPELATLLTVAIANGIQWTLVRGEFAMRDVVVVHGVGPIGLSCLAAATEAGSGVMTGLPLDEMLVREVLFRPVFAYEHEAVHRAMSLRSRAASPSSGS